MNSIIYTAKSTVTIGQLHNRYREYVAQEEGDQHEEHDRHRYRRVKSDAETADLSVCGEEGSNYHRGDERLIYKEEKSFADENFFARNGITHKYLVVAFIIKNFDIAAHARDTHKKEYRGNEHDEGFVNDTRFVEHFKEKFRHPIHPVDYACENHERREQFEIRFGAVKRVIGKSVFNFQF